MKLLLINGVEASVASCMVRGTGNKGAVIFLGVGCSYHCPVLISLCILAFVLNDWISKSKPFSLEGKKSLDLAAV